jgi:hypothetical protein
MTITYNERQDLRAHRLRDLWYRLTHPRDLTVQRRVELLELQVSFLAWLVSETPGIPGASDAVLEIAERFAAELRKCDPQP